MTRLQLIFAATTSTFLLATAPARATDTAVEPDSSIDRLVQTIATADGAEAETFDLPAIGSQPKAAEPTAVEPAEPTATDIDPAASLDAASVDETHTESNATTSATDDVTTSETDATADADIPAPAAETGPVTLDPEALALETLDTDADDALPVASRRADAGLAAIANAPRPEDGDIALGFSDSAPPPAILNPHPNPLRFPTFPEEVAISGDRPISLDRAIDLALRNNLDLQSARIDVERQRQALLQAESAWWPQLDLTSGLTWSESASARISAERQQQISGRVSELTDLESTSWNTELRLRYNIFTSGNRDGNIRAARERLRLTELEVERQTEEVRLTIAEAYYDIQNTDQDVIIAESAVRNSEESLGDAQALERAGVGTQFDVLRAEVQLANDLQRLRQAESDRRVARRAMARLLNLPQELEVSAGDPIELAGLWELPLEDTIVLAFRSRAELEQQIAQREVARQERRVSRSETLPQISAFAAANLLENSDDGVDGLTEGYTAGVQLAWQLFNGGRTRAATRDSELARESAELEFANQRNFVRLQVEQSYYQLEASLQNVSTSENALELARESLELARLRFQAGVGTQTEVIDAQDDLTQAEGNRVDAILGYNRALANLRRAVGNHPLVDEVDAAL